MLRGRIVAGALALAFVGGVATVAQAATIFTVDFDSNNDYAVGGLAGSVNTPGSGDCQNISAGGSSAGNAYCEYGSDGNSTPTVLTMPNSGPLDLTGYTSVGLQMSLAAWTDPNDNGFETNDYIDVILTVGGVDTTLAHFVGQGCAPDGNNNCTNTTLPLVDLIGGLSLAVLGAFQDFSWDITSLVGASSSFGITVLNSSYKENAGIDTIIVDGVSAVPLPAALPLFVSGLGAVGVFGWRNRRNARKAAVLPS